MIWPEDTLRILQGKRRLRLALGIALIGIGLLGVRANIKGKIHAENESIERKSRESSLLLEVKRARNETKRK